MRINAVAFSTNGCRTALRLKEALKGDDVRIYCKTTSDSLGVERIEGKVGEWTGAAWNECDALVYIGAIGIAVRYIAPYVRSKTTDPAVVCMDEHGRWAVALLSGHIGGCNELTARIADRMGSEPIITTATDLNGKFSVDTFAARNGMRISSMAIAKDVSARVLDGRFVGFRSAIPVEGDLPDGITPAESGELGVCISYDPDEKPFDVTLNLVPQDIVLGVGCRRGTDPAKLWDFATSTLDDLGIARQRVAAVSSIDIKSDEGAILELARSLRVPVSFHSAEELNSLRGEFSRSDFVSSVTDVDCVCERSAVIAGGEEFLLRKTPRDGMTIAVCLKRMEARFL